MGLFKNEVGRPSNETIRNRNIFKGICVVFGLIIIGLVVYILNDKGIITFNKPGQNKNDNDKVDNQITTTTPIIKNESFDLSKVSIEEICYSECTEKLSIYGKEVNFDGVVNYGKYYALGELLVIERNIVSEPGSSIIVYDKNGTQRAEYSEFGFIVCPSNYGFDNDCYDFKVEDNKLKYTMIVDAQDASTICGEFNNKESFMEYEVEYKNDILSKPKKIKSLTGKQLINNNSIKCN